MLSIFLDATYIVRFRIKNELQEPIVLKGEYTDRSNGKYSTPDPTVYRIREGTTKIITIHFQLTEPPLEGTKPEEIVKFSARTESTKQNVVFEDESNLAVKKYLDGVQIRNSKPYPDPVDVQYMLLRGTTLEK